MKELYTNQMSTNFVLLDENMKPSHYVYDGESVKCHVGRACFAPVRDWMRREGEYTNNDVRFVKYLPWVLNHDTDGYMEAVQAYIDVLLSIPFVRERVLEYTEYYQEPITGPKLEGSDECYFLVDMKMPVDEGFAILQMLRVPQEFPGRIKTFHDTLKETRCERTAFLAALLFNNSKGLAEFGGHCPTNGISLQWAQEFIKDPGIAKSLDNKWNSSVMGGGSRKGYAYKDFIAGLTGGDPCIIPVAVYGSLRKGLGNHALLSRAMEEGRARRVATWQERVNCEMYDLGAFPALYPSPQMHVITFEVYHVNKQTLAELDALEGYPHFYDRTQVIIDEQVCWVYFHHNKPGDKVVKSGDWLSYTRGFAV